MKRPALTNAPVYAAFLRGVNVGGKNRLNMQECRVWMESLGMSEVQTYIQSGNIAFRAADDRQPKLLEQDLQTGIKHSFGLDVPVVLRSIQDLQLLLDQHPFRERTEPPEHRYVTLLQHAPDAALVLPEPESPDRLVLQGRDLFLFLPTGYGSTRWNNGFWERRLAQPATTRNWKTLLTMRSLLEQL